MLSSGTRPLSIVRNGYDWEKQVHCLGRSGGGAVSSRPHPTFRTLPPAHSPILPPFLPHLVYIYSYIFKIKNWHSIFKGILCHFLMSVWLFIPLHTHQQYNSEISTISLIFGRYSYWKIPCCTQPATTDDSFNRIEAKFSNRLIELQLYSKIRNLQNVFFRKEASFCDLPWKTGAHLWNLCKVMSGPTLQTNAGNIWITATTAAGKLGWSKWGQWKL